jgi:hypothetical protein
MKPTKYYIDADGDIWRVYSDNTYDIYMNNKWKLAEDDDEPEYFDVERITRHFHIVPISEAAAVLELI